jgi:hypothetical protein
VKRVHHRDCVGDFFSCGGLEAGETVHGHDLDPVAERWCLGLEPGLEHLLGSLLADHFQAEVVQPAERRQVRRAEGSVVRRRVAYQARSWRVTW